MPQFAAGVIPPWKCGITAEFGSPQLISTTPAGCISKMMMISYSQKIYDWYADDFGDNEKGLLQHLMRYANQSKKTRLESFDGEMDYKYDWDHNGMSR